MPLSPPFAYIISYDFKGHPENCIPLIEELQKSTVWWHYLQSTWIVVRPEALVELGPLLRSYVGPEDRLLILPANGPAHGNLPMEAWEWIQKNLRNMW